MPKGVEKKIDELRREVRDVHEKDHSPRTWIVRGILFGVGSTLGVVVIFYLFIVLAASFDKVPIIGDAFKSVQPIIEESVESRVPSAGKFLPNSPQTVSDPASLYTLEVDKDWTVPVKEGADGIQVSKVEVESSDFRSRVDESTNLVYYEAGAKLTVEVLERVEPRLYSDVLEENELIVADENATYTIYRRGNTAAGRLIDAAFEHDDYEYVLTFTYNAETFPTGTDVFGEILTSFTFVQ